MDVYASEQEQIELIKKWWRENWRSLAGGIALGLAGLYAFNAWKEHGKGQAEYGSVTLQNMFTLLEQKKTDEAERTAKELQARLPGSIYAALGALNAAKLSVGAEDLTRAKQLLQWAVDNAPVPEVKHIAKIRLARLFLAEGKADQAWTLVQPIDTKSTQASVQEVKGDIQLALGKTDEARKLYRKALDLLGPGSGESGTLQSKLDDLGSTDAKTGKAQ